MKREENNVSWELTRGELKEYESYLRQAEKSLHTIKKYVRDLRAFFSFMEGMHVTKETVLNWKSELEKRYKAVSVNSMLAAVNGFLDWAGCPEYKVKPLKIQRDIFSRPEQELTREEYVRLVSTAKQEGNRRIALVIQTICATGIRVSELQYITAEAVRSGRVQVSSKAKRRTVFLPEKLCRMLLSYLKGQNRTTGAVFVTRGGKPLDRSNIWRSMKKLCESAGVMPGKVFPHNLRHLFARTYYALEKDLSRLADILGHTNVNTTRIYTMESGVVHAQQMERMRLIIT